MSDEQRPIHAHDQRLRTRLQELRAKAWVSRVIALSGLNTPYKLDQKFGGGQRKWKAYQGGQMPNEVTIQAVETAYPGTQDWIERGPHGLALWPALGEDDLNILRVIAKRSLEIDSDFAKLRLDVADDLIEVEFPPPAAFDAEGHYIPDLRWPPVWFDEREMGGDAYVEKQQVIWYDLVKMDVLPKEICDEIATYVYELIQPYRVDAYRRKFEDFFDAVVDTRLNFAVKQSSHEEAIYASVRMKSIGRKGNRSDVE